MNVYRVVADGVEVFRYTEFQRAGRSGVRESGTSGLIDEHAGLSAHAMALDKAEELTRFIFGRPGPAVVEVVREDGTVATEMHRQ